MASIAQRKYVNSGFGNAREVVRVTYDFSKDGGAVGALDLFEASGDCVIHDFHAYVKTTATSGGSATVKVGVSGDDDVFMTTAEGAVANLTANAVMQAKPVLTEGTPNTVAWPFPRRLASGDKVLMTIGTAALTAGKIDFEMVVGKA